MKSRIPGRMVEESMDSLGIYGNCLDMQVTAEFGGSLWMGDKGEQS